MELRDIPIRAMTYAECKEIIAKMGGDAAYAGAVLADRPLPAEPQPVKKSAQEKLVECYEASAKRQGISLEKYFQTHPADYELVRQASCSRG
jgi:hypothetical protein